MSEFPDNLSLIGAGDGKVVLPSPPIESDWNPILRDYEDRTFRWNLVQGLEPDPDLGYQLVEPDHYRLEITPDLNWADTLSQFTPYEPAGGTGNGRLRIFDDLVVGEDLIVSEEDESVTFLIPIDDMKRILAPGYERYLWRVVAVSPCGHEGHPSELQHFKGRVIVPSVSWSVEPLAKIAGSMTVRIHGKKNASVSRIEVNDDDTLSVYPSQDSWEAEVPLLAGRNVFYIRAFDSLGNGSEYRIVETELSNDEPEQGAYFNKFDDFGYMFGVERLPDERNVDLRRRVTDVFVHPSGPRRPGLVHGLTRDLDLEFDDAAILLEPAGNPRTDTLWTDVRVWVTGSAIYVQTDKTNVVREYAEVPGSTWRFQPAHENVTRGMTIEQPIGHRIPASHYTFKDGWVQILRPEYANAPVYLTYSYAERITTYDKTLQQIVSALNALTIGGDQIVVATLSDQRTGTESAAGLSTLGPTRLGTPPYRTTGGVQYNQVPLRWSQLEINALLDPEFIRRFNGGSGSLFGTEYERWAWQLKSELRTTWGFLVADKNVWSAPKLRVSGIGRLPTTWDAPLAVWKHTATGPEYSGRQAWPRGLRSLLDGSWLVPSGVPHSMMRGGIGLGYDLFTLVEDDQIGSDEAQAGPTVLSSETTIEEDIDFGTPVLESVGA